MRTIFAIVLLTSSLIGEDQSNWPQFRGPNAGGIAISDAAVPVEFGTAKRVLWKQGLPAGHSSPVIWGDRLFLTSFEKDGTKLEVLCLARKNGDILWRRSVPVEKLEKSHAVSNPASATPAVDGERVYVYFGSYGLIAFDLDGKQLWTVPLPLPKMTQSSGTSPVIAGDLLLLNRDEMADGYLLAVERKSGKTVWKTGSANGGCGRRPAARARPWWIGTGCTPPPGRHSAKTINFLRSPISPGSSRSTTRMATARSAKTSFQRIWR
jgi:outer membrane protein assembly factor BamB